MMSWRLRDIYSLHLSMAVALAALLVLPSGRAVAGDVQCEHECGSVQAVCGVEPATQNLPELAPEPPRRTEKSFTVTTFGENEAPFSYDQAVDLSYTEASNRAAEKCDEFDGWHAGRHRTFDGHLSCREKTYSDGSSEFYCKVEGVMFECVRSLPNPAYRDWLAAKNEREKVELEQSAAAEEWNRCVRDAQRDHTRCLKACAERKQSTNERDASDRQNEGESRQSPDGAPQEPDGGVWGRQVDSPENEESASTPKRTSRSGVSSDAEYKAALERRQQMRAQEEQAARQAMLREKANAELARAQAEAERNERQLKALKTNLTEAGGSLATQTLKGSASPFHLYLAGGGSVANYILGVDDEVESLYAFGIAVAVGLQGWFGSYGVRGDLTSSIGFAPLATDTQAIVSFDYRRFAVRAGLRHVGVSVDEEVAREKSLEETYEIDNISFLGSIGYRFDHTVGFEGGVFFNATSDGYFGLETNAGISMFHVGANLWITDDGFDTLHFATRLGIRWAGVLFD